MKKYKNCQSCAMPLSKDPKNGGTEKDGAKSNLYCSYCYVDGAFTQPDFTAADMKKFCKEKMKEMGFPGFVAGFFTLGIPKPERWRKAT